MDRIALKKVLAILLFMPPYRKSEMTPGDNKCSLLFLLVSIFQEKDQAKPCILQSLLSTPVVSAI